MNLDFLISVHCCRIMLVNNDLSSTRDFCEHREQWINQIIKALTIIYFDIYVSLAGQRRCCISEVTNVEFFEILDDIDP